MMQLNTFIDINDQFENAAERCDNGFDKTSKTTYREINKNKSLFYLSNLNNKILGNR